MEKEAANNKKGLLGKFFWGMVFAAGIKEDLLIGFWFSVWKKK